MRMFLGKAFVRWATRERLPDQALRQAGEEAFAGQVEADLGGHLFKKRIARAGGGKSGGYRTIIGFRKSNAERIMFLYGFAKNQRATVSPREQAALALAAAAFIDASDDQVAELLARGAIRELEQ